MFVLFLLSILSIFLGFKIHISLFYLLLLIFPIFLFIYLIVKKRFILLSISVCLLIFFSTYTFLFIKNYSSENFNNEEVYISARVENINYVSDTFYYITLGEAKVSTQNRKIILDGKISMPTSNYEDINIEVGYNILFSTKLENIKIIKENGEINSFYLKNNIRYETSKTINLSNTSLKYANKYLNESFLDYNKKLLIENLGKDEGLLAFAVLYGNREDVNDDLLNIFKTTGIMHIFAVSGLHIGLLVSLLYFLFKKLKFNNKIIFVISAIVLLLFCYLCSFSAPVLRATIMALTVMFANIINKKNDSLNTLSFSGLILLFINPMSLFDGGFQMTYISVFGILFFANIFKNVKIKNKILKNIFMLTSVSISTQLALLPVIINYYGYITTWSLIANLITLPIFSIFYSLLFIFNIIALILPFLGFLLIIPKALINIIIFINLSISKLPFAILKVYNCGSVTMILYYLLMFCISKYIMLKQKIKIIACSVLAILVTCGVIINCVPKMFDKNLIYFSNYQETYFNSALTTKGNNFYLINPNLEESKNCKKIIETLQDNKISNVNGILFVSNQSFESVECYKLLKEYNSVIYLPEDNKSINNLTQMGFNVKVIKYNTKYSVNEFKFEYLSYQNTFFALLININNKFYLEFDEGNIKLTQDFIQFVKTDLNFCFDCVKINNATINYENIFNAKRKVFDSQGSFA